MSSFSEHFSEQFSEQFLRSVFWSSFLGQFSEQFSERFSEFGRRQWLVLASSAKASVSINETIQESFAGSGVILETNQESFKV